MAAATRPFTKRLSFAKQRIALFRMKSVIGEDWIVKRTVIAASLDFLGSIAFLRRSASETFQQPLTFQPSGKKALGRREHQIRNLTIALTEHSPLLPDAVHRLFQEARKILENHDVVCVGAKDALEFGSLTEMKRFQSRTENAALRRGCNFDVWYLVSADSHSHACDR